LSPVQESYMKFDLQPLAGLNITQATLRMWVTSGSPGVQSIKQVADDSWTENSIIFNNRPTKGATVATFTQATPNLWQAVDITSAVAASTGSLMSLAMDSNDNDGYRFNSDEGPNRLELVINWSWGGGGPSPTPAPSGTPTATPTRTPTPGPSTPTPPPGSAFSFGVAGDFGQNSNTTAVLQAVSGSGANFFIALGDFSYVPGNSETAWCNFVKSPTTGLGSSTYPFELISGNHEDVVRDGQINNYVQCLPHRLTPLATPPAQLYGKQYYFDYPGSSPLARFINISPGLTFPDDGSYSYTVGSARYNWVASAIDSARSAGIKYVIVSMHKFCISLVSGNCEVTPDLMNLLISKKVDLYFQAHDHAYSRSKQLAHRTGCTSISPGSFNSNCVVDSDNQFAYGAGTVIATVGVGGVGINSQSGSDPEAGYFATFQGSGNNPTFGFLKINVSSTSLSAQFVRGAGGSFTDSFTIQ
jgi:Calcineurin-like phosphoesterase